MEQSLAEYDLPTDLLDHRQDIGKHLNYHLYFIDLAVLISTSLAIYLALDLTRASSPPLHYGAVVALAAAIFSLSSYHHNLYDWRSFRRQLRNTTLFYETLVFTFGGLLLIGFAFKNTEAFSRLWIALWFGSYAVYIFSSRLALTWYLALPSQQHLLSRRTIILGAGDNGRAVLEHILQSEDAGIRVIGFLDDRAARVPKHHRGVPILGPTSLAGQLVRNHEVDLIIVALPWAADERITALMYELASWAVDIYMAPDRLGLKHADQPIFRIGGMPVLNLQSRPIGEWHAVIKRFEDLCIAIPALMLLSPVMIVTAIAIKLESKGSVLFTQERYGFNNNLIHVYKFRSMYASQSDIHAERLASRGDSRITGVGRFIRRTSIDELPQLFNVLQGNMSIVGPRPHATRAKAGDLLYQDAVDKYASRHRVKPGITGWAQCNGWRGETDTEEKITKRVEHDLYYIENWTIMLDVLIILKTLLLLVKKQDNAY